MDLIVSKTGENWTAVLLNDSKLYYSSSFKSKDDAIKYLTKIADTSVTVKEERHPYIDVINGIETGTSFDISKVEYDFTGFTEKETQVLKTLAKVPAGETISYGELAEKSGFPGAAQFVGNVMMKNRFGPVIPCHRVILSSGKLGKFAGQSNNPRKKQLLNQEMKAKSLDQYF
ncbi:MAG: MGMT family protein [Candidatus Heimdallarchaeota archaeon]|nr:MGMT family protein [Candidatus Heimdallarchaeota archaeon]